MTRSYKIPKFPKSFAQIQKWKIEMEEYKKIFGKCAWCGKNIEDMFDVTGPFKVGIVLSKKLSKVVNKTKYGPKNIGQAVQLVLKDRILVGRKGVDKRVVSLRACSESCAKKMMNTINRELNVEYSDVSKTPFGNLRM